MRQIKFRCWDEEAEEMLYSDKNYEDCTFVCESEGTLKCYVPEEVAATRDEPAYTVGREIFPIMQFTGLLDKNGKEKREVYEGDAYRGAESRMVFVVEFQDGEFLLTKNVDYASHRIKHADLSYALHNLDLIYIGNIYENPELLEQK